MRNLHLRTPDRVSIRRSKSDVKKSLHEVIKKNSNPAMEGASEERSEVLEPLDDNNESTEITNESFCPSLDAASMEDSAVIGPVTELSVVSDDNLCGEITEITKESFCPPLDAASVEDSAAIWPVTDLSEVSHDNLCGEIIENPTALKNPADQPLISPSLSSFSMPLPISEKRVILEGPDQDPRRTEDEDSFNIIDSIELEMVMEHLKEARAKVRRSNGFGHSKKLLNLLIALAMEDLTGGQPDQKTWLAKLSSREVLVPLTFMMVIFVVFILGLLGYGTDGSYQGPPPT